MPRIKEITSASGRIVNKDPAMSKREDITDRPNPRAIAIGTTGWVMILAMDSFEPGPKWGCEQPSKICLSSRH